MAIKVPGIRSRRGHAGGTKRKVVASLSLTAMVDMFTVLVVFLLQNYAVTGEVLQIESDVTLPDAREVKELAPANVVVISENRVMLNNNVLLTYDQVKSQKDWMIRDLRRQVEQLIRDGEEEKTKLTNQLKSAVEKKRSGEEKLDRFRKMTIQADQDIDFLTVKKVMYTLTEAGIYEINFAVIKRPKDLDSSS